ncbi:MAG: AAA family ATPase [Candidatus Binatia bacterium]
MYEKYFGFADLPFRITPEPRYFYSNSIYQEALATLRYGIEARKGFIVITGEVGTGKTTLLKRFIQSADSNIHTAFIFNPNFSFTELLRFILKDLKIPYSMDDKFSLMEHLNDYLIEQLKRDHIVALLFDEAQSLSESVLEELRLFSNVETDKHKLIQIVLLGQPELEQRLDQPQLRQIKQRVALRCCLDPLQSHEIQRYINFRLKTAGYEGEELFDEQSVERITLYSTGIPRLINVICDNALRIAYGLSKRKVSAEMVEQVACDLQLPLPRQIVAPAPADKPERRAEPAPVETQCRESGVKEEAGRFYWTRSSSRVAAGILLGLVVVAGAAIYAQQNRGYLRVVTAGVGERSEDLKQAKLSPKVSKDGNSHSTGYHVMSREKESQSAEPQGSKAYVAPLEDLERARETNESDRRQPQVVEAAKAGPPPQNRSATSAGKEQRFYTGNFKVVGESRLFSKPQRRSPVVTTLWPGMRVRVESKNGNYLLVRSLNHREIRGYVHLDDAYLQRINNRLRSGRTHASQLQSGRSDNFALGPMLKSIIENIKRDSRYSHPANAGGYEFE